MSITDKDYLLRTIRRLLQAVAAILGLKDAGRTDEALAMVRETRRSGFGPVSGAIEALEAEGVVSLLGSAEQARLYAELCAIEAELRERRGEASHARSLRARALGVYRAIEARFPGDFSDRERDAARALEPR